MPAASTATSHALWQSCTQVLRANAFWSALCCLPHGHACAHLGYKDAGLLVEVPHSYRCVLARCKQRVVGKGH